jgi:type IV pilus assembly protein PilB
VLVTGPTGSGKTTTLYSALNELNEIEDKLITTEDPVEYDIDGIIQIPIDHDIGVTFAACLRPSCGRTPTRSWWARSATWRRPRSPCRPR